MERLTKRLNTREALMASKYEGKYTVHEWISVLQNRLASYEDTGLTPEEIERIVDAYGRGQTLRTENAQRLEAVRDIGTDRLREFAKADREGRVVVLPCKVGGEVYSTLDDLGRLHQCRATYVLLDERTYLNTVALEPVDYEGPQYGTTFGSFGKTVFLTREEAEEALRRSDDGRLY